jgi:hypothetical protein
MLHAWIDQMMSLLSSTSLKEEAILKDPFGRPEGGGSEWEPIKILPFG